MVSGESRPDIAGQGRWQSEETSAAALSMQTRFPLRGERGSSCGGNPTFAHAKHLRTPRLMKPASPSGCEADYQTDCKNSWNRQQSDLRDGCNNPSKTEQGNQRCNYEHNHDENAATHKDHLPVSWGPGTQKPLTSALCSATGGLTLHWGAAAINMAT